MMTFFVLVSSIAIICSALASTILVFLLYQEENEDNDLLPEQEIK